MYYWTTSWKPNLPTFCQNFILASSSVKIDRLKHLSRVYRDKTISFLLISMRLSSWTDLMTSSMGSKSQGVFSECPWRQLVYRCLVPMVCLENIKWDGFILRIWQKKGNLRDRVEMMNNNAPNWKDVAQTYF